MSAMSVTTQAGDDVIAPTTDCLVPVTAAKSTQTRPSARAHAGVQCTIKNTAAGTHTTIVAQSGQSIDGADSYKLTGALGFCTCVSDGANRWVVAIG